METKLLNLPFTQIQVLRNGEAVPFEYKNSAFNKYYIDDKEITVLGAIEILIDPELYDVGDIIDVQSSIGKMTDLSAGEAMYNAVGELEKWTYGFGGPDTAFIEWNFGSLVGDITEVKKYGYKHHVLSYEFIDISESGMKYKIVPGIDNNSYNEGKLKINIVWESNDKEYAYEITSFLSC